MKKLFVPLGLVALAAASSAFAQTPAPAAAPAAAPATPAAAAATHAPGMMSPAGQLIERMLEPLHLTPDQHAQISVMREKFEVATDGLRADLRAGFMQLRRLRGAAGDPVEAEAKRKELAGLQEQLRGELERLNDQIDTLLDPAQHEQFAKLRASLRQSTEASPTARPAPTAAPPASGARQG